ncbi:unnamed protein product [Ectocarpus sp. 13 AM-2016]
MGWNDGKSTTKSTVPDSANDRGRPVQYISNERRNRNKPSMWCVFLMCSCSACPTKADYIQSLLQDRSVPEHVRTWPTCSEMCTAGSAKRERSRRAERPFESSEWDEETAGIDSGAADKKAGGAGDEQVAERVERNSVSGAITVLINQTLGGQRGFVSTLELELASLGFCMICRHVPSLTLRVGKRAMRHQKAGLNNSSRVPALRPSAIRGQYVKEAMLSKHHKRIDCRSASRVNCGKKFDEPIAGFPGSCSLRQLEFGRNFDQPIVSIQWQRSLQKLTFNGLFNQLVEGISWPSDLRELGLGLSFTRPIEDVAWPKSLRVMRFGPCLNQPIQQVKWPSLVNFELDVDFNHPILQVEWPESLQQLTFGYSFDQAIDHVTWPTTLLEELEFGDMFNKEIENVSWPAGLRQLTFVSTFNQPIERVTRPACLEVLIFGDDFNKPIEGAQWPSSLKKFTLGLKFEQPIANVPWPQAFEHLHLENISYDFSVEDMPWLPSLRYVTMGEDTVFKSIAAFRQDSGNGSEASRATLGAAAGGDNLSESVE